MSDSDTTETHSTPDPLGLVVALDGAAIGRVHGGDLTVHRTLDRRVSRVPPGNADEGREERERERASFFERVVDAAEADLDSADAIAVGGTVTDVDELREALPAPLADRIVITETVEYGGEKGLKQLRRAVVDDEPGVERFFDALGDGRAVYGEADVRDALGDGTVESLFVAPTLAAETREELETAAREADTELVVVDADADRGTQFVAAFGGVGALLRA